MKRLLRALKGIEPTLNGWRFQDLKDHIRQHVHIHQSDNHTFDRYSFELLTAAPSHSTTAYISNLPPETTGIADFTFGLLSEFPGHLDVFCPVTNLDWFLSNQLALRSKTSGNIRLFPINLLLSAHAINNYSRFVIALGNSDHNFFSYGVLSNLRLKALSSKVVVHLHDPCLLNLAEHFSFQEGFSFADYISQLYPGVVLSKSEEAGWRAHAALSRSGVFGLRIFSRFGVNSFIVHSACAAEHLYRELGNSIRVIKSFHPWFPSTPSTEPPEKPMVSNPPIPKLGIFGIPGSGKLTTETLSAAEHFHLNIKPISVVVAGYGWHSYLRKHRHFDQKFPLHILDSCSLEDLDRAIRSIDAAIQLRRDNLGESSGVIPRLLASRKAVLVSNMGAFAEFGDEVYKLSPPFTSERIASAIEGMLNNGANLPAIDRWVSEHSVEKFFESVEGFHSA